MGLQDHTRICHPLESRKPVVISVCVNIMGINMVYYSPFVYFRLFNYLIFSDCLQCMSYLYLPKATTDVMARYLSG